MRKWFIITGVIILIISIVIISSYFLYFKAKLRNQDFVEKSKLLYSFQDIINPLNFDTGDTNTKYEFWKSHKIEKTDFNMNKSDVININSESCELEFDKLNYQVEYGKMLEKIVPRRFCRITGVTGEDFHCECWYVKKL
jgi:hypothetical protein